MNNAPARTLGALDATCVVVGAIVGVGIFFTPSSVARAAGSGEHAMLAWAFAGFIALLGALVFAELGGMYSASAAQYEILRDSYSPLVGFLFVFCTCTAILSGVIAIIAIVCVQNIAAVFSPDPPGTALTLGGAAGLIIVLALANVAGTRQGALIQNITVFSKIATLITIAIIAARSPAFAPPPAAPDAAAPSLPWTGILTALVPAFFSYGGWQQALWISGEVKHPQRNLPRAILGGVLLVITIYLLANWAYLHLLGVDAVQSTKTLAADAVAVAWGSIGRRIIAGAVAVSAFGILNVELLSGPRLIQAMARDGRFFPAFAHLHSRTGTPARAITLLAVLALILLGAAALKADEKHTVLDLLLNGVMSLDGTIFALTGAALIVLRIRRPGAPRSFRAPAGVLVAALFVAGELAMVVGQVRDPEYWRVLWIAGAWVLAGIVIFTLRFRSKDVAAALQK